MAKETPKQVQVEGRQLVREMHSKAILSVNISARDAYLKRRAVRRGRQQEVQNLRAQAEFQNREMAEMKVQIAELIKLVKNQTTTKKKVTRRKKSEDS